jgi:hypothetical protein
MNKENKENVEVQFLPERISLKENKVIISPDTNKDGFISLQEFISADKSLGPREVPGGLFKNYAQSTLSYHFINLLIRTKHPIISKIVCLPNLSYCIYSKLGTNFKDIELHVSIFDLCDKMDNMKTLYMRPLKSNILFFNPPEYTKDYKKHLGTNAYNIVIPETLKDNLYYCSHENKNMVFINLTLVTTLKDKVMYQHANILIINLLNKTIERFDPHGGSTFQEIKTSKIIPNLKRTYKQELIDEILRDKFKSILPEFKYIDLSETCPYLGPQVKADQFNGLCITWSLMYFLLRVLNPEKKQSEINKHMITGNREFVLDRVLRFQRYVIDYLRNVK